MAGKELTPEEVAAKLKEKDTLLEQALQQLQDANQMLKEQEDQYKQDIKNSQQQVPKPIIIYPPSDKKIKKFWGNPFHHKDYQDVDAEEEIDDELYELWEDTDPLAYGKD